MTVWQAIVLGIVQGVSEFLPISSSGHLVIIQHWLGVTDNAITFEVVVHFGSLVAVIIALREEIQQIFIGLLGKKDKEGSRGRRLLLKVIMATIPVVVVGITLHDLINRAFSSIYVPAIMLFLTGTLLLTAEKLMKKRGRSEVTWLNALWMGLGQALAVLPGLSRSGTTISAGMISGVTREAAARFSFLISIPAIAGATVMELPQVLNSGNAVQAADPAALIAGALAAVISSYLAISLFLKFLKGGRLMFFVYYTWALGAFVLLLST